MLCNWYFGDYFKRESLNWAWELLIDTGVDTNALALEVKNDGWLVAPGSLFSPKQGASTMMRFNVSRTTPEFMSWLKTYLQQHR